MSLIFGNTNIESVTYNGTALDKVIYNGVVVWENWVLKTGFFNKHGARTYDYSGSTICEEGGSHNPYYYAFDGSTSTSVDTNNANIGRVIQQKWTTPIKFREIKHCIAGNSGGSMGFTVWGIKQDGSLVTLFTHTSYNWQDTTLYTATITSNEEFIGIRAEATSRPGGWGYIRCREIQITKWLQKGN